MDTTQLCITVIGKDADAIRQARAAAEVDADLVELRLDSMASPDPEAALAGRRKPAIVTCRPLREGGMFDGSEEERLRILERAQALGAEFIDIEWDIERRAVRRGARRARRDRVAPRLPGRAGRRCRTCCGGCARPAGKSRRSRSWSSARRDLRTLLENARPDGGSVLIGMGRAGLATRVLARRDSDRAGPMRATASRPGQVSAARLLRGVPVPADSSRRRASTRCSAGRSADSLSPAMHNAGFAALGLNAVYVPIESRDLDGFTRVRRARSACAGASVTIPFKRDVMPLLDEVAPTAAAAGAVNTIAIRDGRWIGMNTDADGFLEPLRRRLPDLRRRARGDPRRGRRGARRRPGASPRRGARGDLGAAAGRGASSSRTRSAPTSRRGRPPPGSWDLLVNATPVGSARRRRAAPFDGPVRRPARLRPRLRPGSDGLDARRGARRVRRRSAAWRCWSRRPNGSSRSGPASGRRPGLFARGGHEQRDRQAERSMKQTTFDEFKELARRGTFVPVVKEIMADLLTPVSAFLKIAEHSDYAFLFESVEGGEQVARYSFLGQGPVPGPAVARRQDGRWIGRA